MAIRKCPECGKDVSDKAKVCVHCGYPFKENKTVKIFFPVIPNKIPVSRARIEAYVDGKLVFSGGEAVEVASFEIQKPTRVTIKIQRWSDKAFVYPIEPGKRYQLIVKIAPRSLIGLDVSLNEVDVIDADRRSLI